MQNGQQPVWASIWKNTYHQLDDAYLTSNTQKIVIETDSFDVFKSGSLKSEFSDVSQEPFYYLISWFEMMKLRDKNIDSSLYQGVLLMKIKKIICFISLSSQMKAIQVPTIIENKTFPDC